MEIRSVSASSSNFNGELMVEWPDWMEEGCCAETLVIGYSVSGLKKWPIAIQWLLILKQNETVAFKGRKIRALTHSPPGSAPLRFNGEICAANPSFLRRISVDPYWHPQKFVCYFILVRT
ncbi:hypothetical protein ES332_A05G244200v1 [Gossypium tomentosum]|uniref:Uncharacterized protein n=1 Tax=Gossypium tomentosum TaxID=34277 RepID=A0A5D2QJT5_GOSTO|nr:hypothetical protein ES332_A05G244200v1 [Gossypium tomentosum]